MITANGRRRMAKDWGEALYKRDAGEEIEALTLTFIPYFAWANRGAGEMQVWVREAAERR
ncbi:hypothetical protein [Cohnella lubricantis]|uniref:Non-reducing end beta-L-arabinofuranosidase-like GH127 C-terminal domain-containing protein n=1 Tax=Cohnella lubricantis TaxID=2163172 RepID=A0A841TF51_9BACL|nr:hypothetical protein [Cohnella lubricantis]MBB6677918.1 hypothetical protein [Cohnella lubricantis]MBP2120323.1 DUF1680 family protein [Cohnella lubricantis]